jgi:hypothetical protein
MNLPFIAGDNSRKLRLDLKFQGLDASWAGPRPFRAQGFCVGSEDGRLIITDEGGTLEGELIGSFVGEAINGVAYWNRWIAVSTRAEVNVLTVPTTEGDTQKVATFHGGAHDVIATPSGHFVAPLGRGGLMVLKPVPGQAQEMKIISGPPEEYLNAYRVVCLSRDGKEVLACAMRSAGVGAMEFQPSGQNHQMHTIAFEGLDVVDICAIDPSNQSLALAALGRDGTVLLCRDILKDKRPIPIKYDQIQGTAYRLQSCRGHLFLLTSKGLHFIARLPQQFLAGESFGDVNTPLLVMPMEAVDANLCLNRWLLVVMPDRVSRYDVSLFHESIPDTASSNKPQIRALLPEILPWEVPTPRRTTPPWKERTVDQHSKPALASVP